MEKTKYSIRWAGIMKTFMMVLIVLYHSVLFFANNWYNGGGTGLWSNVERPAQNTVYDILALLLDTILVQGFFMCSGYLFYYLRYERNKYRDFKKDILKRFKRLILPYFFFALLWVGPMYAIFYGASLRNMVGRFVLMSSPVQLWFLPALFLIFVSFYMLSDKIKLNTKNLVLLFIVTQLIGVFLGRIGTNIFQIQKAIGYSVFFYLGGYIWNNQKVIEWEHGIKRYTKVALFGLSFAIYVFFEINDFGIIGSIGKQVLRNATGLFGVMWLAQIFVRISGGDIWSKSKLYNILERNSFGVYLLHEQIIYWVFYFAFGVLNLPSIIVIILSFTLSLWLSVLMSWLISRSKVKVLLTG